MRKVREVRDKILSSYRDARHFYSDDYPPHFVGSARARYIKAIGETEVAWNSDRVRMRFYAARLGEKNLESGEIEIEGDLSVTAIFGREGEETYFFSRTGLLKAVANGYSHIVRHEIETTRGSRSVISEREYWPHLLEFYLKHGNFDIPDERFSGFRRTIAQPSDEIERAHYDEMIDATRLTKEAFDKSKSHKSLVALKSIKPFSKAVPKRVEVQGENMRILYIPSDTRTRERERLSGGIYLHTTELQAIPTPAVIRAGFVGNGYAEFPVGDARMIRTDRQPKEGRLNLEAKELELYAGRVGEAEFGRDVKEIFKSLMKNKFAYVSIGLTLGLPFLARFARIGRIRPLIIILPLIGVGSGAYSLYRAFDDTPKKVIGDEHVYCMLRGKELTSE